MNKLEITEILDAIVMYYPSTFMVKPEAYKATVESWHLFLQDISKDTVTKNLIEHVKTERFPPSISDLLKVPTVDKLENGRRAIPNAEETLLMLEQKANRVVATPEQRQKHLANIAEVLGIEGEKNE